MASDSIVPAGILRDAASGMETSSASSASSASQNQCRVVVLSLALCIALLGLVISDEGRNLVTPQERQQLPSSLHANLDGSESIKGLEQQLRDLQAEHERRLHEAEQKLRGFLAHSKAMTFTTNDALEDIGRSSQERAKEKIRVASKELSRIATEEKAKSESQFLTLKKLSTNRKRFLSRQKDMATSVRSLRKDVAQDIRVLRAQLRNGDKEHGNKLDAHGTQVPVKKNSDGTSWNVDAVMQQVREQEQSANSLVSKERERLGALASEQRGFLSKDGRALAGINSTLRHIRTDENGVGSEITGKAEALSKAVQQTAHEVEEAVTDVQDKLKRTRTRMTSRHQEWEENLQEMAGVVQKEQHKAGRLADEEERAVEGVSQKPYEEEEKERTRDLLRQWDNQQEGNLAFLRQQVGLANMTVRYRRGGFVKELAAVMKESQELKRKSEALGSVGLEKAVQAAEAEEEGNAGQAQEREHGIAAGIQGVLATGQKAVQMGKAEEKHIVQAGLDAGAKVVGAFVAKAQERERRVKDTVMGSIHPIQEQEAKDQERLRAANKMIEKRNRDAGMPGAGLPFGVPMQPA